MTAHVRTPLTDETLPLRRVSMVVFQQPAEALAADDFTYTFDAAGNQQIEQAPGGKTTNTWNYENQRTGVVKPDGSRVTMIYNADWRCVYQEPE